MRRLDGAILTLTLVAILEPGCTPFRNSSRDSSITQETTKPPPEPPEFTVGLPGGPSAEQTERQPPSGKNNPIEQTRYAQDVTSGTGNATIYRVPDSPTEPGRLSPGTLQPLLPRAADPDKAPPDEPIVVALRCLLEKRLKEAVQAVERYEKPNQDALLLMLPWVARLSEGSLDKVKPQELATFLEQMDDFSRALRPRAALALGKVCFCNDVRGFGMIDAVPAGYAFQAGRDGRDGEVLNLYVEVRNFGSRPVGNLYETRLAGKLDVFDAKGQRVWGNLFRAKPDTSVSPRHDYFIIFTFWVPASLPPGHYKLAVEVTDQTWQGSQEVPAHRTARRNLEFDVTAGDAARGPARQAATTTGGGG